VPANLKGKRIGVTDGTTSALVADMVLTAAGLSRDDVHLIDLPPDAMVVAMSKGELDAASTWQPFLSAMQKDLGPRGLTFDGFDVQGLFSLTVNLTARPEFIETHPETVRRMLRAIMKSVDFMKANPDEARRMAAAHSKVDEALMRDLWRGYRFGVRLNQTLPIALEGVSRWAIQNRLTATKEVPNYAKFIDPRPLQSVNPGAVSLIR
jgi:NitT/TauT family transport system substrate-binding protein